MRFTTDTVAILSCAAVDTMAVEAVDGAGPCAALDADPELATCVFDVGGVEVWKGDPLWKYRRPTPPPPVPPPDEPVRAPEGPCADSPDGVPLTAAKTAPDVTDADAATDATTAARRLRRARS